MLDSSRSGMTRSSSHPSSSIYGKDFLELVWENGPVLLEGGSTNRTQKTPLCIGYPMNPSHNGDEGARTTKRTRLSTSHSLLDQFPAQRDSGLSSSQSHGQSSYQIMQSSQSKNSYKSNEEFPNLIRPVKDSKLTGGAQHQQQQQPPITASNSHVCTYSSQQCFPSTPFKKPKIDSSQTPTTPTTNSQKQYLQGCDEQRTGPGKVNFSNFLIPAVFLKSTHNHHQNSARNVASSARVEEIEFKAAVNNSINSSKALDQSAVIESSKQTTSLTANKWNQASLADQRSVEPPFDDEHSEAVGHNNSALGTHGFRGQCNNQTSAALKAKGKVNANLCNERASSSVYSLGASNDPNFGTRKYEETDDSAYLSDNDEEPENTVKEMPAREGNNRVKRSRNSEIHNLSERKRRDKINEKIRTLKELIPNCNKMDKASMLDDAIDYLKTLKLQLQIMTMGSELCMPLMMLPAAAHHMNAAHPHLPQLMGAGMGFRPGTGIPCNPPQFPIPPLPGVTDNRLQMFGFSNQMPPIMPIPNAPFINPIIGNSSTQPPLIATSTALAKSSAKSTTLHVSNPNN